MRVCGGGGGGGGGRGWGGSCVYVCLGVGGRCDICNEGESVTVFVGVWTLVWL